MDDTFLAEPFPKIWPGETAFIIGGGPSLWEKHKGKPDAEIYKYISEDLAPLHDKHVIGTNNAYLLGSWVDVCWWVDDKWWRLHKSRLAKFAGLKCCCADKAKGAPDVHFFSRHQCKEEGIETMPGHIAWNTNAGGSAINLAWHFGATRVVLLGMDMRLGTNFRKNWHMDHESAHDRDRKGKQHSCDRHLRHFPKIAKDAHELGIEVLNATPGSAIEVFPMVRLEDVL